MQSGTGYLSGESSANAAAVAVPPIRIDVPVDGPPVDPTPVDPLPVDHASTSSDNWQDIRADSDIQFSPVEIPKPKPREPGWFDEFFKWMGELLAPLGEFLGLSWPVLKWVLLGLAIAALLYLLWQLIAPALGWRPQNRKTVEPDWAPVRSDAIALLEDADRLATAGDFDGATHLLLQRSVRQIADARPDWVEPSSTARELAALSALPDAARKAFSTIAERVERSLFALRKLGSDDWQAARDAYASFALERL